MGESIKSTPKTNILDLNDDCLREIFEYLELEDLCVVKDVCLRFKAISRAHVASKKLFEFENILLWDYSHTYSMVNQTNEVNTNEFLRRFGAFIESLTLMSHNGIRFTTISDQNRILESLNPHCVGTLNKLELWNFYIDAETALLVQPLLRGLRQLRLEKCSCFESFVKMLAEWAPELRKLEFDQIKRIYDKQEIRFVGVQLQFRSMEEISLKRVSNMCNDDIEELLKWNPQLKHIEIDCKYLHERIYDSVFKLVPQIESVRIRTKRNNFEWNQPEP